MNPFFKRVEDWAEGIAKTLTLDQFQNDVKVIHDDGSVFAINHAFLVLVTLKTEGQNDREFVVCFSEHNGILVWSEGDLFRYQRSHRDNLRMPTAEIADEGSTGIRKT